MLVEGVLHLLVGVFLRIGYVVLGYDELPALGVIGLEGDREDAAKLADLDLILRELEPVVAVGDDLGGLVLVPYGDGVDDVGGGVIDRVLGGLVTGTVDVEDIDAVAVVT